ncbi:SDR family NAD(P)-dependent oxidoreductase [Streptomyces sp. NPDC001642]|uniref:SDR family NAD(P)-dependent oxidoreductase n=1 Tax=Streptomyces sp. NPDC001642 TaxID=3154392 RepID=UPI003325AA57
MTAVGIATGTGRGMGLGCAWRLTDLVAMPLPVGRDELAGTEAAKELAAADRETKVEAFVLDITDPAGLSRLTSRVAELGSPRAVSHAAGISPTMAEWRRVFEVDLVGTARPAEALRPLASEGTGTVCVASTAPLLVNIEADPVVAAIFDEPLRGDFLDRLREVLGPAAENTGLAYVWAKHGVHRSRGGRRCGSGRTERGCVPSPWVSGIDVLVDGGVCAAVRECAGR